jgi:hypothetical protein
MAMGGSSSIMRRDIIFLVRGIPTTRLLRNERFFMAPPGKLLETRLAELSKVVPRLRRFLEEQAGVGVVCAGFRNDHKDESLALEKAWNALAAIIDGFAFVNEGPLLEVCPVIQVREGNAAESQIKIYGGSGGWAHFHPGSSESAVKWREREFNLFTKLLTFFSITAGAHPKYKNDLGKQIGYSAKMFRCGIQANNFGVEYLCKFSALEGLVCGGKRHGKKELLKARLKQLFAGSTRNVGHDVERLWSLRCKASHQARAFYDEDVPGSNSLLMEICNIEYLLTGVLVFALDHAEQAKHVEALWSRLSGYSLPDYVLLERPADMPKLPYTNVVLFTPHKCEGAGASIDAFYKPSVGSDGEA